MYIMKYMYSNVHVVGSTAYPTCSFVKLEAKLEAIARRSLLPRFSAKRPILTMSVQVG